MTGACSHFHSAPQAAKPRHHKQRTLCTTSSETSAPQAADSLHHKQRTLCIKRSGLSASNATDSLHQTRQRLCIRTALTGLCRVSRNAPRAYLGERRSGCQCGSRHGDCRGWHCSWRRVHVLRDAVTQRYNVGRRHDTGISSLHKLVSPNTSARSTHDNTALISHQLFCRTQLTRSSDTHATTCP